MGEIARQARLTLVRDSDLISLLPASHESIARQALDPKHPDFKKSHEELSNADFNTDQKQVVQDIINRGLAEQERQTIEQTLGNLTDSISDKIGARAKQRRQTGKKVGEEI